MRRTKGYLGPMQSLVVSMNERSASAGTVGRGARAAGMAAAGKGARMDRVGGGLVAFLGAPGIGGPYRTGKALRDGLRPHGFTVRWLCLGPDAQALIDRPEWAH